MIFLNIDSHIFHIPSLIFSANFTFKGKFVSKGRNILEIKAKTNMRYVY